MTISGSAVILEIFTVIAAAFALFRNWSCTTAEAVSYAVISSLMIFSFIFQTVLIIGMPMLSIPVECFLIGASIRFIIKSRHQFSETWRYLKDFSGSHRIVCAFCGCGVMYLAALSFLIPPVSGEWNQLSRAVMFHRNNSFFIQSNDQAVIPLYPVNSAILPYLFLRLNSDAGIGVFGLLAYISIGFSTYALSRRYSWSPMAFTVSLMVMSMPRLVLHASSPGLELIPAAASVFCILAITRTVEQPNIRDISLLIFGIFFSISGEMMCLVFPLLLFFLSGFIFIRRHGTSAATAMIRDHKWIFLLAIPIMVVFSQSWLFAYNYVHFGTWMVPPPDFSRNTGDLKGAIANLMCYLFESAHMTQPVHLLTLWLFGFNIPGILNGLSARLLTVFFGNIGASIPLNIEWIPDPQLSWFGPISFFLIIPAIIFGMIRGQRRIKAVSLGLISYALLISLITSWKPGNAQYFTLFFACGGYIAAFFLPPWRITQSGQRAIQGICLLLFFYFCFFNTAKPLLTYSMSLQNNIWSLTRWGTKRFSTAVKFFEDNRVTECATLIKPDSRTAVIYKNESSLYPFIAASKQTHVIFAPFSRIRNASAPIKTAINEAAPSVYQNNMKEVDLFEFLNNADYLLLVDISEKDLSIPDNSVILWKTDPSLPLPCVLIQLVMR